MRGLLDAPATQSLTITVSSPHSSSYFILAYRRDLEYATGPFPRRGELHAASFSQVYIAVRLTSSRHFVFRGFSTSGFHEGAVKMGAMLHYARGMLAGHSRSFASAPADRLRAGYRLRARVEGRTTRRIPSAPLYMSRFLFA